LAAGAKGFDFSKEEIKEQLAGLIPLITIKDLALIEKEIGLAPGTLTAIKLAAVKQALEEAKGIIKICRIKKQ
jgi:hypothetical protein